MIGGPREDATDGAGGYICRVHIVFGSPTGLLPGSAITLDHPASDGNNFDDFGASIAPSRRSGPTPRTAPACRGGGGR